MPPEKEREDEGPQEVLAVGPLQTVAPRSFILMGLFLLVLFHTLLVARDLFLPLMLAFFLSFLLRPLLRMLKRAHIPEAVGAALLLVVLVGGVGVGLYLPGHPGHGVDRQGAGERDPRPAQAARPARTHGADEPNRGPGGADDRGRLDDGAGGGREVTLLDQAGARSAAPRPS